MRKFDRQKGVTALGGEMEQTQKSGSSQRKFYFERPNSELGVEQPPSACLHELFESQVDQRPTANALFCGTERLTYAELEFRANQLAHYLKLHGIGPGKLVGLYFERSARPIIGILACLKAGAAYVPIDPGYPNDRVKHIATESNLALILTEQCLEEKIVGFFSGETIVMDAETEEISGMSGIRLTRSYTGVSADDLCYIIYTSGTTGRPKGVMTEHRNAYRFVNAFNEICGTTASDRIYQGFSLGFDGSVEEIWMAFSNGSALVVGTPETPRFGNDLAQFLTASGVTYFSTVPTMLSTITDEVPTLRQLVVSGEACPPELVSRWAKVGRKMWNVYGPTEATVNSTVAECIPGKAITIGKPIEGYNAHILDAAMQPVRPGEKGELFIGGPGLARGYLGQPGLTSEKFVTAAFLGGTRLYRTGDLVRFNTDGELEFFGRIDGQVKIRGYRVELSEIEAVLLEHGRVRSVSVRLFEKGGIHELAAFIVVNGPELPVDRMGLLSLLESRLPDYMIPQYLDVLEELPMLTSGKVDRTLLPRPKMAFVRENETIVAPSNELEAKIAGIWAKFFTVPKVSVEADFFLDLGGHSLLAAQMVTKLRAEIGREVAVRDAYRYPTVRKLANLLSAQTATPAPEKVAQAFTATSRAVFESLSRATRLTTASLQAISLYFLFATAAAPACYLLVLAVETYRSSYAVLPAFGIAVAVGLGIWPAMMLLSIVGKWAVIGKYRAGKYPVWGFYYFRWWLATRLQGLSGAGALTGTPLLTLYYRAMGAKVGKNALLETVSVGSWDLLSIGEETSIGADTQYLGYRVEGGYLHLGSVNIGDRCFVGIHSALGLNSAMGDDCRLDDQSYLSDNTTMKNGEARRGSPAQLASVAVPQAAKTAPARPFLLGAVQLVLLHALAILMVLPASVLGALVSVAMWKFGVGVALLAMVAAVPVGVVVYCFYIAVLKKMILWRAEPGIYCVYSRFYVRKWLCDELMKASRALLLPLYTTLYFPPWLRLLGAKIGRHAELSTVWYFSPDLVDIGEESFFADGSIVGGKRFFRGQFEIAVNKVGRRSFVGNSAILPVGKGLGDKCLLGVLSAPPVESENNVPDGSDWLGSPAFSLPHRLKVGGFDDTVTFQPTRKLYAQRAVVDAFRVLIPGYIGMVLGTAGLLAMFAVYQFYGATALYLTAPFLGMALGALACLSIVLLKKAVMGTFGPVIKPLWCLYVWLNEMVNGAYESVMSPALVPLKGTPFIATFLRMIGCKIGKHTYLESTLFSEWDLVEIGDYAAINAGAIIQTHLFEDRVMKSSSLKVGAECSVGNMAVVLYDTEMQRGSTLAPLSLLMKGESLTPNTKWHGIPTIQIH